ncbi:MAG TPA: hypothetical protein ENK66_03660 [Arcobacter sp.]|nr:hypothetical protein [Arcobacter sp.]
MNTIYIFGADKFKKNIKSILTKENITSYETINSSSRLEELIKESPKECYIIDHAKLYSHNIINKYLKFLIPKDGVNREFLKSYGIGDLEFNSYQKAIDYIKLRYNLENELDETNTYEEQFLDEEKENNTLVIDDLESIENIEENETQLDEPEEEPLVIEEPRDLSEIKEIEEIKADEMDSVISEIENKG